MLLLAVTSSTTLIAAMMAAYVPWETSVLVDLVKLVL